MPMTEYTSTFLAVVAFSASPWLVRKRKAEYSIPIVAKAKTPMPNHVATPFTKLSTPQISLFIAASDTSGVAYKTAKTELTVTKLTTDFLLIRILFKSISYWGNPDLY